MKLWLDDIREPWRHGATGFNWVKTYEEAISALETGEVTFASLDHDLSVEATLGNWQKEITGYHVVLWMESTNTWPRDGVRVHSMNPVGKRRMEDLIYEHYGRNF